MSELLLIPEYLPAMEGAAELERLLKVLGSKRTLRIIHLLRAGGSLRFLAIKRLLPGITNRVLSRCLDALLTHGIVQKIIYAEKIPHVEYILTENGIRTADMLSTLIQRQISH